MRNTKTDHLSLASLLSPQQLFVLCEAARRVSANEQTELTASYGFKKQKYPLTSDSKRPTEADWYVFATCHWLTYRRWEFSHPDFQRGRSDLMEGIKRKGNDNGVSGQPYTRAPQSAPRATRRQVKAAPVAPQLQHQQEFATQKAQLNFYILRHRETQMELEALQIAVDRERGRANRLAMLGVTLLSICRTSFPGAREFSA